MAATGRMESNQFCCVGMGVQMHCALADHLFALAWRKNRFVRCIYNCIAAVDLEIDGGKVETIGAGRVVGRMLFTGSGLL